MRPVIRLIVIAVLAAAASWLPAARVVAQAPYRIGEQDLLKVGVWSQPELGGEFTVDVTGGITLPLIGAVKAAGRTVEEVSSEIRTRLADGYVNNPQVTVAVSAFRSQRVFVVGEVRTPGVVPLTGTLTLVEALTRVGSLTDSAGGEIVVIRPAEGRPVNGPVLGGDEGAKELMRIDVKQLQAKGATINVELKDGDTVLVPRAEMFYVIGQVNGPGSYVHERDLTVLQAVSRAGGVNEMGTTNRLKIMRIVNGKRTEIKATLSDLVRPGDTLIIASRRF